jgi:signal transduction histidine kinase
MAAHAILVVDDEPASVRAVQRALAEQYRVLTASGGAQGLATLAAEPVALMIVDQRMPGMSGTEFLARCAVEHPDTIRVLLTGYTAVDTLVEAINAGHVYHYLTKPWEPRELRLVVRRGLERYEAQSERRRLLGELERACARLRREAERKGRLLAMAAHELGTPLHLLSNALSLMAEAGVSPAASSWLDTARRNTEWLGRGLAQLADGARWGASRIPLRRCEVDVPALLLSLRRAYEPALASRRLGFRVEAPAGLPQLRADRVWLGRALSNLVSNAIRFTPDGGTITVAAAVSAAAVHFTVADTGVGIDESLLPEVFEPFSAAGGDLARHASGRFEFGARGFGLGLSITKAVVEQHGGTIAVRSRLGAGSVFTVTLPLGGGEKLKAES